MLIVDTGPLVAFLSSADGDHERCTELLTSRTDELLLTPYVVAEACYLVSKYVGPDAEINLVDAIAANELVQVDTTTAELHRITELMRQYRGFPLGLADASVVALAERLKITTIATLDRRHFHAITPVHADAFELRRRHCATSRGGRRGVGSAGVLWPERPRVRLKSFPGHATDLGARAREIARAELGEDDADR